MRVSLPQLEYIRADSNVIYLLVALVLGVSYQCAMRPLGCVLSPPQRVQFVQYVALRSKGD